MTEIRCVIFDMDDVLCDYSFDRRMAIMADALDLAPEAIVEAIYTSGFDHEADEGRVGAEDYLPQMGRRLDREVPLELWLEARRQSMRPNPDMLTLAHDLGARMTVAMLTNNNLLLQRYFAEVYPEAAALFGERAFFSAQFGTGKDWPEVFDRALAALGHRPGETLFIDDTANYVVNARKAGLNAHHFKGFAGLRQKLRGLGVTITA